MFFVKGKAGLRRAVLSEATKVIHLYEEEHGQMPIELRMSELCRRMLISAASKMAGETTESNIMKVKFIDIHKFNNVKFLIDDELDEDEIVAVGY